MDTLELETGRLILRPFRGTDLEALYALLSDPEVNTFLPWFPVQNLEETRLSYETRLARERYCFAICLNGDNFPIGYVHMENDGSHDFGYALRKEYWHRGIVSEACGAVIERLKQEGIPYITATHNQNNPRSGAVMKRLGMRYCYSYQEQWQPKNFPVIFRMYQLNLDGREHGIYQKYWDRSDQRFIETVP